MKPFAFLLCVGLLVACCGCQKREAAKTILSDNFLKDFEMARFNDDMIMVPSKQEAKLIDRVEATAFEDGLCKNAILMPVVGFKEQDVRAWHVNNKEGRQIGFIYLRQKTLEGERRLLLLNEDGNMISWRLSFDGDHWTTKQEVETKTKISEPGNQ